MKVADLQQHIADLRRLIESAGGKGAVLADLTAIGDGLQPFREYALADFANFLIRAEMFSRGEVPVAPAVKGRQARRTSSNRTAKEPKPDAQVLAREVKQLYDQASAPSTTPEAIAALGVRLGPLTKAGLMQVAAGIDLKLPKSAKNDAMIAAIEKRIADRRGSFQRAGLLDRPTAPTSVP